MLARGLTLLYVVRLLDHFAFGQGARLDIKSYCVGCYRTPERRVRYTFVETPIFSKRLRELASAIRHQERSVR